MRGPWPGRPGDWVRRQGTSARPGPEEGRVRAAKVVPEERMMPRLLGAGGGSLAEWPGGTIQLHHWCCWGVGTPCSRGSGRCRASSHVGEVGLGPVPHPVPPFSARVGMELGFPPPERLPTDLISLFCVWKGPRPGGPAWRGAIGAAAGRRPAHLPSSPAGRATLRLCRNQYCS